MMEAQGARRGRSGEFPLGSAPVLRVRKIHDMTWCPTSPSVAVMLVGTRREAFPVPWKITVPHLWNRGNGNYASNVQRIFLIHDSENF